MRKEMMSCIMGLLCLTQYGVAAEADRSADHQALRLLRDKVETSLNTGNMLELRTCLASEFTFITSDQVVLTNGTDVATYWDKMFKSDRSPIKALATKFTAGMLTQFVAPNVGYCRGTSRDVYTLKCGRKIALINTWSTLLTKEKDGWKISTAHVAVDFLDNPVLAGRQMSWFSKLLVFLHLRKLPGEVNE